MASQEEYLQLISPWQIYFDETWQKNFYYNPITQESVWELPYEINQKVQEYYESQMEEDYEEESTNNVLKYIPGDQRKSIDNSKVLQRPARKQVEQSLSKTVAYQQGNEEYNIWYDKWLTDNSKFKEREPAPKRCEPEVDAGYTKADFMEKYSTYFCIHFAKGCCAEGPNCRFYHRTPTFEESLKIDNTKDIFGRARFANQREDMQGVGSFLHETRTVCVSDFRMPEGNDPLRAMYEILWRHFSAWGEIEDMSINPGKGVAFIKYSHRCMAEFAKEAMKNQSLDSNEILTVRWALHDDDPLGEKAAEEKKKEEEERAKKRKKKGNKKGKGGDEDDKVNQGDKQIWDAGYGQESLDYAKELTAFNRENELLMQKKKELELSLAKMNEVLQRIDNTTDESININIDINSLNTAGNLPNNQGTSDTTYDNLNYYSNVQGIHYIPPDQNNLPLFMK